MTTKLAGLYIITPLLFNRDDFNQSEGFNNHDKLDAQPINRYLEKIETVLKSGARIVQFRDKSSNDVLRLKIACALFGLCNDYSALFIINDDVTLARKSGAHGVHLGKNDASVSMAREELGNQAVIGVSCYNQIKLAHKAQTQGADYVAFGRFFSSNTKPKAAHAEVRLLTQAKKELHIPLVAIGGINHSNAAQLIKAGADSLAVVGGVFDQADISIAAQSIADSFNPNSIVGRHNSALNV